MRHDQGHQRDLDWAHKQRSKQLLLDLSWLHTLKDAGPCPLPTPTACSWFDPTWIEAWMRCNPDIIDQQITAITAQLARLNQRKATP